MAEVHEAKKGGQRTIPIQPKKKGVLAATRSLLSSVGGKKKGHSRTDSSGGAHAGVVGHAAGAAAALKERVVPIHPQVLRVQPVSLEVLGGSRAAEKELFYYFRFGFKSQSRKELIKTPYKTAPYDFSDVSSLAFEMPELHSAQLSSSSSLAAKEEKIPTPIKEEKTTNPHEKPVTPRDKASLIGTLKKVAGVKSHDEKIEEKEKEREKAEKEDKEKEDEKMETGMPESFLIQLWSSHYMKDSLQGTIEIPLVHIMHNMLSDALEQQRDFWLQVHSSSGVPFADIRIAMELGRSDATLESDIRNNVVRLVSATRGDVDSTAIWPRWVLPVHIATTNSNGMSSASAGSHSPRAGLSPRAASSPRPMAKGGGNTPPQQGISGYGTPTMSSASQRAYAGAGTIPSPTPTMTRITGPVNSPFVPRFNYDSPQNKSPAAEAYGDDSSSAVDVPNAALGLLSGAEYGADDAQEYNYKKGSPGSSLSVTSSDEEGGEVEEKNRAQSVSIREGQDMKNDLEFNEEWQSCVEALGNDAITDVGVYETISDLSHKFCASAKRYGSIIVSEMHLDDSQKVIKPMQLGGVIGGKKFCVGGVLFKVARPSIDQIGEEEAQKIAGHELKALTALFNVNSVNHIGLALPMISLLDCCGFRLVALALAPLGSSTLIHGSADAGQTILSDPIAQERLRIAGSCLNLKVHTIRNHEIQLAIDVEGHAGRDGRFYVIDLSRTLPPQKPNRAFNPLSHLFQMLRPELVRGCPFPLCSDACSSFVSNEPDKADHAREVATATDYLLGSVVPTVAAMLDQLHTARSEPDWSFFSLSHLKRCLHVTISLGVNRRFLLKVHSACISRISKQLLLLDVVARVAKKRLRHVLRTTLFTAGKNHDVQITKAVARFWNALLSHNQEYEAESLVAWRGMADGLISYFGPVNDVELDGVALRSEIDAIPQGMLLLFTRTNEQLGTVWSARVLKLIDESNAWFQSYEEEKEKRRGLGGAILDTAGSILRAGKSVVGGVVGVGQKFLPRARGGAAVAGGGDVSPRGSEIITSESREESFTSKPDLKRQATQDVAAAGDVASHVEKVSPFIFWAMNASQMFFEEDVVDGAGMRIKLNNLSAIAGGLRAVRLSQQPSMTDELRVYFRKLAEKQFEAALMSNPTNALALQQFALVLLQGEAARLGKPDWRTKDVLTSVFWSSAIRYVDFLFRVALESNPYDSSCLYHYALLHHAGGRDRRKICWMLLRAVLCDHDNVAALEMLSEVLQELQFQREHQLITLWLQPPTDSPGRRRRV